MGFMERPKGMSTFFAKGRAGAWREDLTPAQVARLRGPVGLPLGGRTPAEIAVSIAAELVAVRQRAGLAERDASGQEQGRLGSPPR